MHALTHAKIACPCKRGFMQSAMARRLFSKDQAIDMIQDDSDSGSEPNFSDSEDDFDDFDDHSDGNNSDNAQEIGPVNRQVRGGPRGRKGRGHADKFLNLLATETNRYATNYYSCGLSTIEYSCLSVCLGCLSVCLSVYTITQKIMVQFT